MARSASGQGATLARLIWWAALLVFTVSCGGGGSPGPGPGPGPTPRYDLEVSVTISGAPAAGAWLMIGLDGKQCGDDGRAVFQGLAAGNYTLSAQSSTGKFASTSVAVAPDSNQITLDLDSQPGFRLVEVVPFLGQFSASPDPEIHLRFSEPVDPSSFVEGRLQFTPSIGSVSLGVLGNEVVLQADRQLPLNQMVVCTLGTGIQSLDGEELHLPARFAFRTPASDNAPPRLISSEPLGGAAAFPPNLAVRMHFSEPVAEPDAATSVKVTPDVDLRVSVSGSTLVIGADGGWELNTTYSLECQDIADLAGNRKDLTLVFTTGSEPAPSTNVQPEWNRVLDTIVFAGDQLGTYDIYRVNPDGSGLSVLLAGSGDELHPSLSADGLLIAYQAFGPEGDWDIHVGPVSEPSLARAVTSGPYADTSPAFSRTYSRSIFFTSFRSSPAGLYVMGEDGSAPTPLDPDFSSAQDEAAPHPLLDSQVLFTTSRSGSMDVWSKILSIVGGPTINQNITSNLAAVDKSPAWAPDASFVVFVSDRSGAEELWLADPGGSIPRQVTDFGGGLRDPSVSPFVGSADCAVSLPNGAGGWDIAVIDLVGGEVLRWLTGEGVTD